MFWIIALVILAIAAAEGYFIGAVRATFAFLGMIIACMVAVPLTPIAKPVLGLFGVTHFLMIAYLGPILVWIAIVLAVRGAGESVNYKINYFYKYKVGDEMRLLWQRLIQRVGLCVGVLNGAVYVFTFSVLVFAAGYPIVQVSSGEQDPFMLRMINSLGRGLDDANMDKAVAPFAPESEVFYDAADVTGLVYQNPKIQVRLGRYPPFLSLMERPEFGALATDKGFQSTWTSGSPIAEIWTQEKVQPLVTNREKYTLVLDTLDGDLTDLKTFLETGTSPKFSDTLILGRWDISISRSYREARRENLSASPVERLRLKTKLENMMKNATFTAFVDNSTLLRARNEEKEEKPVRGTWKRNSRHTYTLSFSDHKRNKNIEADVEEHIMSFRKDDMPLVWLK